MKVIICGSISAVDEILRVKKEVEKKGHEVEIPEGVKRIEIKSKTNASTEERADIKIKYDLIRGYYEKMKRYDVALIVNPEKKGIKGYIGGNTLIEMAFAHILQKPLFCLYAVPDMNYASEIIAMQPYCITWKIKQDKNQCKIKNFQESV